MKTTSGYKLFTVLFLLLLVTILIIIICSICNINNVKETTNKLRSCEDIDCIKTYVSYNSVLF